MHWIIVDSIITHFLKLINPTCNLSQHISQDVGSPSLLFPNLHYLPFVDVCSFFTMNRISKSASLLSSREKSTCCRSCSLKRLTAWSHRYCTWREVVFERRRGLVGVVSVSPLVPSMITAAQPCSISSLPQHQGLLQLL